MKLFALALLATVSPGRVDGQCSIGQATCAPGAPPPPPSCEFAKMLTPVIEIAEILPQDAVSAECKAGGDASAADMAAASKVATECTAIWGTPRPQGCAKPAPEDEGSYCAPRGCMVEGRARGLTGVPCTTHLR